MRASLASPCFALFPISPRHGLQPAQRTWSSPPSPPAPTVAALAPLCRLCSIHSAGPRVSSTPAHTCPTDACSYTRPTTLSGSGLPASPREPALSSPDTLSQRSALCAARRLRRCRKPEVRSLCSPGGEAAAGSSASEGDCPCARREGRDVMEMHAAGLRTWRIQ